MVTDVVMPQLGLEVSEGTVASLSVAVGDEVAEGDTLMEVETEKAISEVVAPRNGFVVAIDAQLGETVAVGAALLRVGDSADDSEPARPDAAAGPTGVAAPIETAADASAADAPAAAHAPADDAQRPRAAPVARRAAARLGIPLERIQGSGPRGRIVLRDVESAAAEGETAAAAEETAAAEGEAATEDTTAGGAATAAPAVGDGDRREPLSATRQAIARRMAESQQIPQFSLAREIDASWMLDEKARLTAEGPVKVGIVDLLVQALAEAVARHPSLTTSFVPARDGQPAQLLRRDGVDVGLAVATERGLLVPVVTDAHESSLERIVAERTALIDAARAGRLKPQQMTGAAVTLSSLGTFGVDSFTALLNPGESAILAVGRTVERAVPRDRGLAVVPTLTLTATFDHRILDGATGALALAELADLLEGAMAWRT